MGIMNLAAEGKPRLCQAAHSREKRRNLVIIFTPQARYGHPIQYIETLSSGLWRLNFQRIKVSYDGQTSDGPMPTLHVEGRQNRRDHG